MERPNFKIIESSDNLSFTFRDVRKEKILSICLPLIAIIAALGVSAMIVGSPYVITAAVCVGFSLLACTAIYQSVMGYPATCKLDPKDKLISLLDSKYFNGLKQVKPQEGTPELLDVSQNLIQDQNGELVEDPKSQNDAHMNQLAYEDQRTAVIQDLPRSIILAKSGDSFLRVENEQDLDILESRINKDLPRVKIAAVYQSLSQHFDHNFIDNNDCLSIQVTPETTKFLLKPLTHFKIIDLKEKELTVEAHYLCFGLPIDFNPDDKIRRQVYYLSKKITFDLQGQHKIEFSDLIKAEGLVVEDVMQPIKYSIS
jgi:hypothetical protein